MKQLESSNSTPAVVQLKQNAVERHIALSSAKKVRDMTPDEVETTARQSILKAFELSGNRVPQSKPDGSNPDLQALIQELYNDMRNDYAGVSGEEIREAILRGAAGKLDVEFHSIVPKSWNEWISAYLKNETRLLALKSLGEKPEPPEPSDEVKRQAKLDGIELIDKVYKLSATASIIDHLNILFVFNELLKARLIDAIFDREMKEGAEDRIREKNENTFYPGDRIKEDSAQWEVEVLKTCKAYRVHLAFQKMRAAGFDLKQDLISKI